MFHRLFQQVSTFTSTVKIYNREGTIVSINLLFLLEKSISIELKEGVEPLRSTPVQDQEGPLASIQVVWPSSPPI